MLEADRTAPEVRTRPASRKSIPGPRGDLLLGSVRDLRKDLLTTFEHAAFHYGDVVRLRLGPKGVYLVFHPDDVHHVLSANKQNYRKGSRYQTFQMMLGQGLATSEGTIWEQQRRLLQPLFTPRQVARFTGVMHQATRKMLQDWEVAAGTGRPIDVAQEMMKLTMSVITRTMFSIDMSEQFSTTGPAFRRAVSYVYRRVLSALPLPTGLPTPANRRFRQDMRTLNSVVYDLIDERRRQPELHDDLLSVLLDARHSETGDGMSREQIRDQVLTIFLAGHETTANALSWTWYLLSTHPEVERAFYATVDEALGGGAPSIEHLPGLKYVEMVIQEAIRLYPPVYVISRETIRDDEIGGYRIPAGATVALSPYVTHRLPQFWEDPKRFDPHRFSLERCKSRPRYAYFPFGGGPRQCLGLSFAMIEAQLVAGAIVQRFQLQLQPGHPVSPQPAGTLQPRHGLLMTVHSR